MNKKNNAEDTIRVQLIHIIFNSLKDPESQNLEKIELLISECEKINNTLLTVDTFIVKAHYLLYSQKYNDALFIAEKAETILDENTKLNEYDFNLRKGHILLLKGISNSWIGDYKTSRKNVEQSLKFIELTNDLELYFIYYHQQGIIDFRSDEIESAVNHQKKGYQLAWDKKNPVWIVTFSLRLGEALGRMGKLLEAIGYCESGTQSAIEIGLDPSWFFYLKACHLWNIGELEQSILLFKEVLPKIESEVTPKEISLTLTAKAIIEWVEGDINNALNKMEEAIKQIKKTEDLFSIHIISIHHIRMLYDKGEFNKILDICFSLVETYKKINREIKYPDIYFEMGKAYHNLGEFNLAFENIKKALDLWKKYHADLFIVQSLFILIQISLDKNNEKLANDYLEEFRVFVKQHPKKLFDQMYKTAQAIILKSSTQPRKWAKAVDILIEVINTKILKHGYAIIAHINLCELLMNEFSISGDTQVLQELESNVKELARIANKENIHYLRLEVNNLQILTRWLKAQKSMVELDIQKAKTLLDETRKIADEKGLLRLAEKLSQQHDTLLKQLSDWDDFIRKYYEFIKE